MCSTLRGLRPGNTLPADRLHRPAPSGPPLQGLGKTITGLALILKTQGLLPAPPRGVEVRALAAEGLGNGNGGGAGGEAAGPAAAGAPARRQYYTLADATASSMALLQAAQGGPAGRGAGGGPMRRTRSSSVALGAGSELERGSSQEEGEAEGGLPPSQPSQPSQPSVSAAEEGRPAKRRCGAAGLQSGAAAGASASALGLQPSCSLGSSLGALAPQPSMCSRLPSAAGLAESQSQGASEAAGGGGGGQGEAAGEDGGLLWLECSMCKKWRRVPPGYPVGIVGGWVRLNCLIARRWDEWQRRLALQDGGGQGGICCAVGCPRLRWGFFVPRFGAVHCTSTHPQMLPMPTNAMPLGCRCQRARPSGSVG